MQAKRTEKLADIRQVAIFWNSSGTVYSIGTRDNDRSGQRRLFHAVVSAIVSAFFSSLLKAVTFFHPPEYYPE
jgi:hypothetical protein